VSRLAPQPGERIARDKTISFTFDGRRVEAVEGDTVGSALYAAGRRTFSRSFKYHRRRGLMCCAGQCPNCIVAVNGAPGARACVEPARDGMRVEHLNARPSLEFDLMRATDLLGGPFMPPGFYYKTFIHPRRLWPLYEKVLRNAAGLGRLPEHQPEREWRTEYRHADVLVIGGGAAGLAAATAAARLGADVVMADEGPEPGGRMLVGPERDRVAQLTHQARTAGVEILSRASALGYFDGMVPVWQDDTLHQIRARHHVFATGTIEQPLVFAGNDLPGVMLADGARRLVSLYAVSPGLRAVLATTSDRGLVAARELQAVGVEIVAVADLRPDASADAAGLRRSGIPVFAGHTVIEAAGRNAVSSAVIAPTDGRGGASGERRYECDLVIVSGGAIPASSLALQAGAQSAYDERLGHFSLSALPGQIKVGGEVAGAIGAEAIECSGELAGRQAARAIGLGEAESEGIERALGERLAALRHGAPPVAVPPAVIGAGRGKCFACLCEDVTSKDVKLSIDEGYDSIELSKRYTTVTMGPCQGRMCQLPAVRLMAQENGQSLADVGTTTARPPWVSVPMGILGGRPAEPAKRSSIHGRHRELGATVKWAGDWRRAYDYGDPEGEALCVNRAAGLIDVSTLGKLLVRGPDAGEFLDTMYPNRFSNLKPGRIRYGVISSDAGRIVDDGTVCRIDDESFYVTTTSSGAGAVEEWFSWWLADWGMKVALTDLTQGLSAVNLAGPRARKIMGLVTDLDCSNEAFSYLDAKHAEIAGVPCLILRIGFVGEVGYEIHFSAAYGEHLWDSLLAAGEPFGLRPFGLEPQRILRLQKMHILVGQDTDSESTPFSAAMPWIVKLDKEQDYIGKWALEHYSHQTPATSLVGFSSANGHVPTEGSVVVDDQGEPVGQVTSSRHSPVLDRVIGMAWVPAPLARDGARVTISDEGHTYHAEIQTKPFYDPDGELLRS
jgi:sarcosine oxidase subunit alpha